MIASIFKKQYSKSFVLPLIVVGLFIGLYASFLFISGIWATPEEGGVSIVPVSVGSDNLINQDGASWRITVTTTENLQPGDLLRFEFPSGKGFDFSNARAVFGNNILENGGIEEWSGGSPAGWSTFGTDNLNISQSEDSFVGDYALQVTCSEDCLGGDSYIPFILSQSVSGLVPGQEYKLSFYVKGNIISETYGSSLGVWIGDGDVGSLFEDEEGENYMYNFSTNEWFDYYGEEDFDYFSMFMWPVLVSSSEYQLVELPAFTASSSGQANIMIMSLFSDSYDIYFDEIRLSDSNLSLYKNKNFNLILNPSIEGKLIDPNNPDLAEEYETFFRWSYLGSTWGLMPRSDGDCSRGVNTSSFYHGFQSASISCEEDSFAGYYPLTPIIFNSSTEDSLSISGYAKGTELSTWLIAGNNNNLTGSDLSYIWNFVSSSWDEIQIGSGENLLINSDFEGGWEDSGVPVGWTGVTTTETGFISSSTDSNSGDFAVQLSTGEGVGSVMSYISQSVAELTSDQEYNFSFYMKSDDEAGAFLLFLDRDFGEGGAQFWDFEENQWVLIEEGPGMKNYNPTSSYQLISESVSAPETGVIVIAIGNGELNTSLLIDDMSFGEALNSPSGFFDQYRKAILADLNNFERFEIEGIAPPPSGMFVAPLFGVYGENNILLDAVQVEKNSTVSEFNLGDAEAGLMVDENDSNILYAYVKHGIPVGSEIDIFLNGVKNGSGSLSEMQDLPFEVKALRGELEIFSLSTTFSLVRAGNDISSSGASISASSYLTSASSNYTISFVAPSSIPAGGIIGINFPNAFDISNITIPLQSNINEAPDTPTREYLSNGGFEDWTGSAPTNWEGYDPNGAGADNISVISATTSIVNSGTYALKIDNAGRDNRQMLVQLVEDLEVGEDYVLTSYARGGSESYNISEGDGADIMIDGGVEAWDGSNNLTNYTFINYAGTSTLSREDTEKRADFYSARIDYLVGGVGLLAQDIIGLTPDDEYKLRFYAKTGTSGKVRVIFLDSASHTQKIWNFASSTWEDWDFQAFYPDYYREKELSTIFEQHTIDDLVKVSASSTLAPAFYNVDDVTDSIYLDEITLNKQGVIDYNVLTSYVFDGKASDSSITKVWDGINFEWDNYEDYGDLTNDHTYNPKSPTSSFYFNRAIITAPENGSFGLHTFIPNGSNNFAYLDDYSLRKSLIKNGSFEQNDGTNIDYWPTYDFAGDGVSVALPTSTVSFVQGGSYALVISNSNLEENGGARQLVYQEIEDLVLGETYDLSFYALGSSDTALTSFIFNDEIDVATQVWNFGTSEWDEYINAAQIMATTTYFLPYDAIATSGDLTFVSSTISTPENQKMVLYFMSSHSYLVLDDVALTVSTEENAFGKAKISATSSPTKVDNTVYLTTEDYATNAGDTISVKVNGVVNPSAAGTYNDIFVYTLNSNYGLIDGSYSLDDYSSPALAEVVIVDPTVNPPQPAGSSSGSSVVIEDPPVLGKDPVKVKEGFNVNNKEITLLFDVSNAEQVAISEKSDFIGVSWVKFAKEKKFTLSSGAGEKTIYVKFRSKQGTTSKVVSIKIKLSTAIKTDDFKNDVSVSIPTSILEDEKKSEKALFNFIFTLNLRAGASGAEVRNLQTLLKHLGFFNYQSITGFYGQVTTEAVRAYQRARGISPLGIVGPQTREALNKDVKGSQVGVAVPTITTPASSSKYQFNNYLYVGSIGEEVRQLQTVLRDLGYFKHPSITGYFGEVTKQAVIEFQQAKNLSPFPGWVGPGTRSALNNL
ncbi:MAG: peptidoglycan-binding protein [Bacteroidales bacterium]|nr:peptidoglycan-binding protein [Bacteroidales bacterium]